jgi:hypothetical protein
VEFPRHESPVAVTTWTPGAPINNHPIIVLFHSPMLGEVERIEDLISNEGVVDFDEIYVDQLFVLGLQKRSFAVSSVFNLLAIEFSNLQIFKSSFIFVP